VRLTLLRLDESNSVVLLGTHHIVNDFSGQIVLVRDLIDFYDQERGLTPHRKGESPVSYSEFVREEAVKLRGESGDSLAKYWETILRPLPDRVKLPVSNSQGSSEEPQGATHMFEVPSDLARGIKELSRHLGATPYTIYLSSLAALLQRYGNDDIIVGTALTMRDATRFLDTAGNFVQIVPIRMHFDADADFKSLLNQVRDRVLGAMDHADYPFATLVEKLSPPREVGRAPLFDVMFVYQKPQTHLEMMKLYLGGPDDEGVSLGSLEFFPLRLAQQEGQVDLHLEVVEWGERASVLVKYNQHRMNSAVISRLEVHWLNLLRAFVNNPSCRIHEPLMLEESELRSILAQCVGDRAPHARDLLVLDLFKQSVERCGASEAVVVPAIDRKRARQSMSYADLEERSSRVSTALRKHGVKPGDAVVVQMARGIEQVIIILGVLKSGGAYVPVDPTYPQERISWILQDSGATLMVTDKEIGDATIAPCPIILADEVFPHSSSTRSSDLCERAQLTDRAYVMYTSGSTGKPKGVAISQSSLANLLSTTPGVCEIEVSQIWSTVHSMGFDLSVLETWGALCSGGTLVVVPSDVVKDPEQLRDVLLKEKVSVMMATPSLARQLLKMPENSVMPHLRRVLFCGEALTPDVADGCSRWGATVYNLYGPTEATVFVSALKYQRLASGCSSVPVGTPLPNTGMIVVDSKWNVVPRGISGELCLLGESLALGYHNQPTLTEVAFPIANVPAVGQVRLYRTGDWFMLHDCGDLEFLGRRDFQVKINGHRIELGELEAVMASHPSVKQVGAVVKEGPEKARRIFACLTANDDSLTASTMLSYLEEQLPPYLIPARLIFLPELPLNSHGKLDRERLSQLVDSESSPTVPISDMSESERVILGVWQEVLRSSVPSLDANFFETGGSSLLLIEVSSRLKNAGYRVRVLDLFKYPTVRRLAAFFDEDGLRECQSKLLASDVVQSRSRLASQRMKRAGRV
jgi:amino acid adenylation domain-containing protein